jgi:hypothetical protein
MAKGKGAKIFVSALFLGVLLLIAVALAVGSHVTGGVEGLAQSKGASKGPGVPQEAHMEAVHAAATQSAGPDPKPASADDQEPSKNCTAEACAYVPGAVGATIPSPGDGYAVTHCGPMTIAHKAGTKYDCSLASMSHAIAGICAKNTKDGDWCALGAKDRDAWVPLPASLEGMGKAAAAASPVATKAK